MICRFVCFALKNISKNQKYFKKLLQNTNVCGIIPLVAEA